jgi:MFS family permease
VSDPYAALRRPGVAAFIFGRMLAAFGRQMVSVTIGWELYERTHSALVLGLVGLVQVLPVLALVLPAGSASDRFDRRRVAMASQLVVVCCAVALAAASHFDAPLALVYAILAVHGGGVAFLAPASSAMTPSLVPPELFVNANAWRSSTFQLAAMGGPATAGLALSLWRNAAPVYLAAAALGLVFCLTLTTLPPLRAGPPGAAPSAVDMREGLRFVWRTRLLLAAITLDMFAVLLGGATALLPIYAKDILHVGPSGLGWLRAAPALGALFVALLQTRLTPWRRPGRVLLVVVVGFGLATIGFGLSRWFALSFACLVLLGLLDNVSVVIRATLEQVLTPDRLRGRVGAVHYVFIGLSNELGEFESGFAAWLVGPVAAVVLGGAGTLVVVALVVWRWPELAAIGPLHTLRPAEE